MFCLSELVLPTTFAAFYIRGPLLEIRDYDGSSLTELSLLF